MAYDKILKIRYRLDRTVAYAMNGLKTQDGETERQFVTALNCDSAKAYRDMEATKNRWNKTGGVMGYHIIHSYKPGEVTPEQAHAIGVEFARRIVGDRFEAVIGTHLDRGHLHCHIVFNSVSCVDGKKFRDDFKAYFHDIRGTSNELSRENGLSVLEPNDRGKHYSEWDADKNGRPTVQSVIRQDIDEALAAAVSLRTLFALLEEKGYSVRHGPNIMHTSVRPPGGRMVNGRWVAHRSFRLDKLGKGYSEEELLDRLNRASGVQERECSESAAKSQNFLSLSRGRYRVRRRPRILPRTPFRSSLRRRYLYYLYLLDPPPARRQYRKTPDFSIRAEVRRLEQYKRQFALLQKYRIDTPEQLDMLVDALHAAVEPLEEKRRTLYHRRRMGENVDSEIADINARLRQLRRELRGCRSIMESAPRIREQLRMIHRETPPPVEETHRQKVKEIKGKER